MYSVTLYSQPENEVTSQPANTCPSQKEADMARRRYQKGSLFLRGKRDPVWVGRWREDVIEAGRSRRVYRKEVIGRKRDFPTRKLALRELEARISPINSPGYRGLRSDTFAQFSKWWQENILTGSRFKPCSRSVIESQLRVALVPFLGKYLMKDISWQILVGFINNCTKSPRTCQNYLMTLKLMWKSAKAGAWVNHNPFEGLQMPKCPPAAPFFYTAEEAKRIIAAATGQYKALYWLAAETGLRPGEICGLRLENLFLPENQIRVTHSIWHGELQRPKTHNALRTIAISDALTEHLAIYLKTWRTNPMNLLFCSATGGPIYPSSLRRDKLGPLCDKLGIKAKGLKAFRHCSATLMDQANIPLKLRQERLGHAPGSKITMVHYTHAVSADERSAALAVGNMLVN